MKAHGGQLFFNPTCVTKFVYFHRTEGGIPPLVELLESTDTKVQRAAAGALRTLAFKNEANKNQVSFDPDTQASVYIHFPKF